jgi:Mg2+/Co2+ transporter CorB
MDCLNLNFEQIEAHLLNSAYWNYDLYQQKRARIIGILRTILYWGQIEPLEI